MLACDGVLDFSAPAATVEMSALAAQARVAHVIGTTGLGEEHLQRITAAARHAPIVRSGNMSLGVNLLASLVRWRPRALGAGIRYRSRRDASPHEGRCAVRHRADAGRSRRRGAWHRVGRPFGARPRRRHRRTALRRYRLRRLRGGTVIGDHSVCLPAKATHHVFASCRGPQPVRARRAEGGAVGARAQAGALFDGRCAGAQGLSARRFAIGRYQAVKCQNLNGRNTQGGGFEISQEAPFRHGRDEHSHDGVGPLPWELPQDGKIWLNYLISFMFLTRNGNPAGRPFRSCRSGPGPRAASRSRSRPGSPCAARLRGRTGSWRTPCASRSAGRCGSTG